jgi:glycerophosphoryl diester phosphodiesterase
VAVVEADVRLFHGRVEVRHLKTIGPLPIFWDRWELRSPFARRLLLGDLLRAMAPGTELMLDLKGRDPRLSRLVLQAVNESGRLRPLTVCARSSRLLAQFAGMPNVRTVFSVGSRRQLRALDRRLGGLRPDAISIHERLLDRSTVERLTALAGTVMTWPVKTVEDARRLAGIGVRGLITDVPELLEPFLAAGTPT